MLGRTQRWPSAEGGTTSVHARDAARAEIEHFVSSAPIASAADYHASAVGENVSLAIVDAAAEPVGEPGFEAPSRYLTHIANLPLIGHVFDELAEGGVERAVIIARAGVRRELEQVLQGGKSWGVEVLYSEVGEADGQQAVVMKTRENLASGPVLVYPADCLFPGQISAMRDRFSAGDVDCVLLTQTPPESSLPGSRMFATAAMLGPRTGEFLGDSIARGRDPRGLIESLLGGGYRVAVCEASKQWYYSDSTDRLLAANRMILDDLPGPVVDGTFPDDNEVHGRVAISPRAQVSNSILHGPVVIDDDAVVKDSFVGPYTAIGRGATVTGCELDNTMVLPFAEVLHPGLRIEASIIGERASVSRSFELPKGLHLRLPPGSQVTLG
jgi:glucose-1-phosphate thymidylyltransferase